MTPHLLPGLFRLLASLACLPAALAAAAPAALAAKTTFNLPAGTAERALKDFSAQSGLEVLFATESVANVRTAAVQGSFTAREAIDRLLSDTGLVATANEKTGALSVSRGRAEPSLRKSAPGARATSGDRPPLAGASEAAGESPVALAAFTVSTAGDTGYYAANALSGTRTNIRLRDLPQSIQVMTSEFLGDVGAIKLEDAMRYTTAVTPASEIEGRFTFRGFGSDQPRRNSVATSFFSHWDSATIDRIEIVKGPSSPLYGISRPGGFANIITKRPTTKARGSVKATVGSWESYRGELDLSGPVRENRAGGSGLYYRLISVHVDQGSHVDFAAERRSLVAPSLMWRLSRDTEITLELHRMTIDKVHDFPVLPVLANNRDLAVVPRGYNVNGPASFVDFRDDLAMLYVTHRFNDALSVRSVSAYINSREEFLRRQGFVERAPAGSGVLNNFGLFRFYDNEDFNTQTDLIGSADWAGVKSQMVVGHSYSHARHEQSNFSDNTETPFPFLNAAPANYRYRPISTFAANQGEIGVGAENSLYAIADASLWQNRVRLFAGWRGNWAKNHVINWRLGVRSTPERDYTSAPQVGAMYNLSDAVGVYAFYSTSIQQNGLLNGSRADPLEGEGVELGAKFSFLGGKVSGSASVYEITFSNMIVGNFSVAPPTFSLSGEQRSKGFEGELYYSPDDRLSLVAGYAYTDAFTKSDLQRPQLVGQPLQDTSRHAVNTWARYRLDRIAPGLTTGVGLIYRSERRPFGLDPARYRVTVPGYTLWNATVSYVLSLVPGRKVTLQLNLENLTDKYYRAKGTMWGTPRSGQLSAKYDF